jgi:hypothetical protein
LVNFFDVENIEESLKFYIKTLHSELNHSVKSCKKYSENSKNSKLLDPQSRKEMIIRRLDEIEKRQQDILKSLPQAENNSVFFEEVEDKAMVCSKDLEQLQESIHKIFVQDKAAGFNKTSSFYNMISDMEKEVNRINEAVVNYKVNFEVNRKFDDMFKMIEKALDTIYHYDYNLDNLVDDSTMAAYEKMMNLREVSPSKKQDGSGTSPEKGIENTKLTKSFSSDYTFLEEADKDKKKDTSLQKEKEDNSKVNNSKTKKLDGKDTNTNDNNLNKSGTSNQENIISKENKTGDKYNNNDPKNATNNNSKQDENKNNLDNKSGTKKENEPNSDQNKNNKNNSDLSKNTKATTDVNKDLNANPDTKKNPAAN